ncbi:MAG: 23S rRNA (adenine(2503)-C(2))-methyltransferase RlmN [Kiritimatiellia bacterium]|nr:23S rRNA (adenine(2503)-C(2))-methyltransferase RlmN [Lentisphaerota bacterium]
MQPIHDFGYARLLEDGRAHGLPEWRIRQLWHWLYRRHAENWEAMHNLPREMREHLAGRYTLTTTRLIEAQAGADAAGAGKLSLALPDGEIIETVLIPSGQRLTVCVSSQAGCKYRCAFCASGQAGFRRNLHTGEMVEQVLTAARRLKTTPTHVVFMGIGEPLDNYENLLGAVRIINDGEGLRIGARRITISTCGVIPGIRRLAEEGLQVELSVSLHAAEDSLRAKLMPVNRMYPLRELIDACRDYTARTDRIITFEYTLIDGVNAAPQQARELALLLRALPSRVNLIPLSPVQEFSGRPPAPAAVNAFMRVLRQAGLNVTLRNSRGSGVNAACGQLRLRHNPAASASGS